MPFTCRSNSSNDPCVSERESFSREVFFSWIMAALGGVPVNRGAADRDALKAAQSLLEKGASIIVFPEGTATNRRSCWRDL